MKITIPGPPVGKGRPRAVLQGGKIHTYTPAATAEYERKIRAVWHAARLPGFGANTPVAVTITAYHPVPASTSKQARKAMEANLVLPLRKPDGDNIAKAVLDALNGLAYADDKQVVCLTVCKRYGLPRVVVELLEVTPDDHQ